VYSTNFDGERVEFGTSGMLYRSNKLMYDRKTNTLWNQFTGVPAAGPLVGTGMRLELLPVVTTTWGEWLEAHPDTTVLAQETGLYPGRFYESEWDARSIYFNYRETPLTMFPVWRTSDELSTKGQVIGLRVNGEAKAYPLDALRTDTVVNDELGGQPLVVVTVGSIGSRAYERGHRSFILEESAEGEETVLTDNEGLLWRVEEESLMLITDPSVQLPRIPTHNAYWFGWYSFYPSTGVYLAGE
jgi:hypothetical protein